MIKNQVMHFSIGDIVMLNDHGNYNTDNKLKNKQLTITGYNESCGELYYQLDNGIDCFYDLELQVVLTEVQPSEAVQELINEYATKL